MNKKDFDRQFAAKDWNAVEVSRQAGPPIVPYVEPYLHNSDQQVRLLAVDCIAAAGGPHAPQLLIQALGDTNEQVRNNAINALHVNLPVGLEAQLLSAWDANHSRDPYLRQQIPMILGRMQAYQRLDELKARLDADPRQDVKDGIIVGAAKLRDQPARALFGQLLKDAHGKRTADLIEFVKYLDEPWVIPLLVPVLQRREIAVDISTHRHEFKRRECDLAVDEIMRISKARFSFSMNSMGQYSDEQINEVLRSAHAPPG